MAMADLPRNLWYPLFLAREISPRPQCFERFGESWVVCRLPDGTGFMASDRCPHLGASLSQGRIETNQIQCPFHGFRFDAKGHCQYIPALGAKGIIPEKMMLRTIPLVEIQGWIWGWWGDPQAGYPNVPIFEDIEAKEWRWGDISSEWDVHITRAIENQLDVAHLPFVHAKSIGAGGRSQVEGPYVEADSAAIRVWVTNRRDDGQPPRDLDALELQARNTPPNLEFRFPGLWQLRIHPKLRLLVAFVPINSQKTRFYVRACHQLRIPLLGSLYSWILGLSNQWVLREDQHVVTRIVPINSLDATHDHLIAADRAIVRFRKLWRRHSDPISPEPEA